MIALARKNKVTVIVSFGLLVILAVVLTVSNEQMAGVDTGGCPESNMYTQEHNVSLTSSSKNTYNLEFANTVPQQEIGLSNRPCFPKNGALIFSFPTDDKFGIWMNNMKFPIDVVWLDKGKKIVTIEKNMRPDSYPKSFYPKDDSRYVIELNAGEAESMGLKENQALNW